jgi:endonuclease-3 related protein
VRKTPENRVAGLYNTLLGLWGPQRWWPAETRFEVIAGAILVQNTAWTNASHALHALRNVGVLSVEGIRRTPAAELEPLVRSSGYFRQKAARLKAFVEWLDRQYDGSMERMFRQPTRKLRVELLELKGFGRETADSILLYGGYHEIFVVDAYTRRIFERHELILPSADYDDLRLLVERALDESSVRPPSAIVKVKIKLPPVHDPSPMSEAERSSRSQTFNEMHALMVQIGKHYCHRARALCEECPLKYDLAKPNID